MGRAAYKSAKEGVGALSSVSGLNHERAPMSSLQWLDVLKGNNWTNNNVQLSRQQLQSEVLMAHTTQQVLVPQSLLVGECSIE